MAFIAQKYSFFSKQDAFAIWLYDIRALHIKNTGFVEYLASNF